VFRSGLDRHVPPSIGRWLAATLPNARLHLRPDEGHLSISSTASTNARASCCNEAFDASTNPNN
jgi:pimeloyl-ACP methyl ester carboxylesterase